MAQLIRAYCKDRTTIARARVSIYAYYKGKRAVDTSNLDDKFILDGLMGAGVLEDDDPAHNPEVFKTSIASSGKDELVIVVDPLPPAV